MSEPNSNPSGINEGTKLIRDADGAPANGSTGFGDGGNNVAASGTTGSHDSDSNDTGRQGRKPIVPFTQTDSIENDDHVFVSWDEIEKLARQVGCSAAAHQFKVSEFAVLARKKRRKWKGIPDGRTLAKRDVSKDAQLIVAGADLSQAIDRHRATVFDKVAKSIDKFKPKAPKNFKEFESADKIARRALGIDDDKQTGNVTLIKINEAIDQTDSLPHEIVEVVQCDKCGVMHATGTPCNSDAVKQLPNESAQQGGSESEHSQDS